MNQFSLLKFDFVPTFCAIVCFWNPIHRAEDIANGWDHHFSQATPMFQNILHVQCTKCILFECSLPSTQVAIWRHRDIIIEPPRLKVWLSFELLVGSWKVMSGDSANAVPPTQKWRTRVTHIWGDRRGQPNRSAMERPHPGRTPLLIRVPPVPGKYAEAGKLCNTTFANFVRKTVVSCELCGPLYSTRKCNEILKNLYSMRKRQTNWLKTIDEAMVLSPSWDDNRASLLLCEDVRRRGKELFFKGEWPSWQFVTVCTSW